MTHDKTRYSPQSKISSYPDVAPTPGKVARTVARYGEMPVQAKADRSVPASRRAAPEHAPVADMFGGALDGSVQGVAARGVGGVGQSLPHLDTIQSSFGQHDVSSVQAHVGGAAATASAAIGAQAYATGNQVAFQSTPDLHTAAHEAAHVVQQRAGVQLKGGVGQVGDRYEQNADAVADRVVAGKDASDLLGQVAPASVDGNVQCKIVENYSSWLDERAPTKALTGAYFSEFELQGQLTLVTQYCTDDSLIKATKKAYRAAQVSCRTAAANPTDIVWQQATKLLDVAVASINAALDTCDNLPNPYSKTADDNWADTGAALKALDAMATNGTQKPKNKDMPSIPVLPYSSAKAGLPVGLRRLVRDIYASWHGGTVLDERTDSEVTSKTITSNNEGAMRSWHLNSRGSLPEASKDDTPDKAQAMEKHYKDTSKKPGNIDMDVDGPIGLMEYTGAGILNDSHYSKIVLDYKRGGIYLTVTHYQLWSKDHKDAFKLHGQSAQDGKKNPWFFIDMQA